LDHDEQTQNRRTQDRHLQSDEGFFQKEVPDYFPRWIKRVTTPRKEGGKIDDVICDNAATLVYLANQACITPHVWLCRRDKLNCSDQRHAKRLTA
jgi:bifunctional non-homologous end joining protein LigD